MAPEVRAILLEFDGETEIQVWSVTSEKEVWGRGCLTAPPLGTPYQIQFVELIIRRGVGTRRPGPGTEQVEPVPNLRVENITALCLEPAGKKVRDTRRRGVRGLVPRAVPPSPHPLQGSL